jgi:hypothetical protein
MHPTPTKSSRLNRLTSSPTRYSPYNLVPWHEWILRKPVIVAHEMEIGVADSAVEDFKLDIIAAWLAPLEGVRLKRCRWTLSGITYNLSHHLAS